jgi:hypothetical protein
VSTVFVDSLALTLGPAAGGHRNVAPGALDAIGRLVEEGHDVVFLDDGEHLDVDLPPGISTVSALPDDVHDAWLITGDPERCDRHHNGYRMILVGPSVGERTLPTRHCDDEVRDVPQAALLVLVEDVMPATG